MNQVNTLLELLRGSNQKGVPATKYQTRRLGILFSAALPSTPREERLAIINWLFGVNISTTKLLTQSQISQLLDIADAGRGLDAGTYYFSEDFKQLLILAKENIHVAEA